MNNNITIHYALFISEGTRYFTSTESLASIQNQMDDATRNCLSSFVSFGKKTKYESGAFLYGAHNDYFVFTFAIPKLDELAKRDTNFRYQAILSIKDFKALSAIGYDIKSIIKTLFTKRILILNEKGNREYQPELAKQITPEDIKQIELFDYQQGLKQVKAQFQDQTLFENSLTALIYDNHFQLHLGQIDSSDWDKDSADLTLRKESTGEVFVSALWHLLPLQTRMQRGVSSGLPDNNDAMYKACKATNLVAIALQFQKNTSVTVASQQALKHINTHAQDFQAIKTNYVKPLLAAIEANDRESVLTLQNNYTIENTEHKTPASKIASDNTEHKTPVTKISSQVAPTQPKNNSFFKWFAIGTIACLSIIIAFLLNNQNQEKDCTQTVEWQQLHQELSNVRQKQQKSEQALIRIKKEKKAAIQNLKKEKETANQKLADLKDSYDQTHAELTKSQAELTEYKEELTEYQTKLTQSKKNLKDLQEKQSAFVNALQTQDWKTAKDESDKLNYTEFPKFIETIKGWSVDASKYDDAALQLSNLENIKQQLIATKSNLETQLENAQDNSRTKSEKLDKADETIRTQKEKIEVLETNLNAVNTDKASQDLELQALNKLAKQLDYNNKDAKTFLTKLVENNKTVKNLLADAQDSMNADALNDTQGTNKEESAKEIYFKILDLYSFLEIPSVIKGLFFDIPTKYEKKRWACNSYYGAILEEFGISSNSMMFNCVANVSSSPLQETEEKESFWKITEKFWNEIEKNSNKEKAFDTLIGDYRTLLKDEKTNEQGKFGLTVLVPFFHLLKNDINFVWKYLEYTLVKENEQSDHYSLLKKTIDNIKTKNETTLLSSINEYHEEFQKAQNSSNVDSLQTGLYNIKPHNQQLFEMVSVHIALLKEKEKINQDLESVKTKLSEVLDSKACETQGKYLGKDWLYFRCINNLKTELGITNSPNLGQ